MAKRTGRGFGHDPHGKVLLVLADNTQFEYSLAFPRMQVHRWPMVSMVNTFNIDRPTYLTTAQVVEEYAAGWDICSHGYAHVNPTTLPDEPPYAGSLQEHLREPRTWFTTNGVLSGLRHYSPVVTGNAHVKTVALEAGYETYVEKDLSVRDKLPWAYSYNWIDANDTIPMATLEAEVQRLRMRPWQVSFWLLEHITAPPALPGNTSTDRLDDIIELLRDQRLVPRTLTYLLMNRR